MSVQAGIWHYDGRPVDPQFLGQMSRDTAEYGPDGESTRFDASLGMLYRPYHTTPESKLERQPHVSACGNLVTWDGRLDNRDDLLAELPESSQRYQTDLAIVSAAFEQWGTDCFAKLAGEWAVAIWKPRSKELIMARDYAGIRHLFYCPRPTSVVWSTHLKPLLLCADQFKLCDEYFAGFMTLWPEAHRTPYAEIDAVPPGHFVRIHDGVLKVCRYWSFNPDSTIRYKTDEQYEEHFRELFRRAVRERMRSCCPILADLSGGLDSSAVVCMADDICSTDPTRALVCVDTFTAIVRDEPSEEDSKYFTAVEQKRGKRGHHVEICGLGNVSPFNDSYFAALPGSNARPELSAAKDEVIRSGGYRVLLSGTGGDEMLGQALDPRVQLADLFRQLQISQWAKMLRIWSVLLRRPLIHLALDSVLLQMPTWIRTRTSDVAKVDPWVNPRFARRQHLSLRQLDVALGPLSWPPSTRDWFHTIATLANQMGANHPVKEEIRYPYLDQRLVEFLTSIPTEQLLRPGRRRSLMRRALAALVPSEILNRRTKSSSTRYFSAALNKHWSKLEEIVRSPVTASVGFVKPKEFYTAIVNAKNGDVSTFVVRLYRALSVELWLRTALAERVVGLGTEIERNQGNGCPPFVASDPDAPSLRQRPPVTSGLCELRADISTGGSVNTKRKEVNPNELQQT